MSELDREISRFKTAAEAVVYYANKREYVSVLSCLQDVEVDIRTIRRVVANLPAEVKS